MESTLSRIRTNRDLRFSNVSALVVKVTNRCNLDCSYCYENVGKTGFDMEISTFKELVDKTFESTSKEQILFIFHGGEPTLLKDEWFLEAVRYATSKGTEAGKTARFGIQTNLLTLPDRRIPLFKQLNISLGVSLDGPPNIPNPMRERGKRAFENFKKAQSKGLSVGVLMTINHSNYKYFKQIMVWLERDAVVRDFKANIAASVGVGIRLTQMRSEEIVFAQKQIIDYMISTKASGVIEQNLAEDIVKFFDGKSHESLCNDRVCGAGKSVLGITHDGHLLPCGRFQWNDQDYYLGSLESDSSSYDVYVNQLAEFHALHPSNWFDCKNCEARRICSYGCQAFISRSIDKSNIECLPTKIRYKYFLERQTELEELFPLLKDRLENPAPRRTQNVRSDRRQSSGSSLKTARPKLSSSKITGSADYADYTDYVDNYHDAYKDYKDNYKDYNDTQSLRSRSSNYADYTDYVDNYHDAYKDYRDTYRDYKDTDSSGDAYPKIATEEILIRPGSLNGVIYYLEMKDVPEGNREELLSILNEDKANSESKRFGEGVNSWVQKMLGKTLDGSWEMDTGEAGSFLTKLMKNYYGF